MKSQEKLLNPFDNGQTPGGGLNVGIPIKLLYEAEGMKVTVELTNGEIYRGLLLNAEYTMSMTLSEVVRTARSGQVSKVPIVYLRGSGIRFIALPDLIPSKSRVLRRFRAKRMKLEKRLESLSVCSDKTHADKDWVFVGSDVPFEKTGDANQSSCVIN